MEIKTWHLFGLIVAAVLVAALAEDLIEIGLTKAL